MFFRKKFIFFVVVFLMQLSLQAQSSDNLNDDFSTRYFNHLYNFDFKDVKSMLDSVDTKHNAEKHLYTANYYFWRNISGDSTSDYFSLCKKELNNQLDLMKDSSFSKTDKIFYNSLTYSYLMRLELKDNNLLNAVLILNSSIKNFEKALSNKDNNESLFFLSGMYNYFMAYASEKYPVFNPYLHLYKKGNKAVGIAQLKKCTDSKNMVIKTESLYFLLKIYLNTEKDYAAARIYGEMLLKLHPRNIIYHREYYLVLRNLNLPDEIKKEKETIITLLGQNDQLNNYQRNYFKQLLN